jgi:hypothetical protein
MHHIITVHRDNKLHLETAPIKDNTHALEVFTDLCETYAGMRYKVRAKFVVESASDITQSFQRQRQQRLADQAKVQINKLDSSN